MLDAQAALDIATGNLRQLLAQNLAGIRQDINNIKTLPGYNGGIGAGLGIITPGATLDPNNYKPTPKAAIFPGHVRITGKKLGASALNIYSRIQGSAQWKLIAASRTRFPYDDDAPLAAPGVPEVREYMAIGVVADNEIGQPSGIVSVTYGG